MKKFILTIILILCSLTSFNQQNQPIAFHIEPIPYETNLGQTLLSSDTATYMIFNICGVGTDSSCVSYNLYKDSTQGVFVHGGVLTMANEDIPIFSDSTDVAALNAVLGPLTSIVATSQRIVPPAPLP